MSKFWHFKDIANSILKKQKSNESPSNFLLLPNQIGCRIIEMQTETDDPQNLNKQIVMDLLSQYNVMNLLNQKAIQFYEQRGSHKYLLYQKKLQNFIVRPSVSEVLQGKTGQFLLKKQKNQEQLRKMQLHSHAEVKKIIQNSESSGKKQQSIISNQLRSQQKDLQERIKRKRANSSLTKRKNYTTASFTLQSSQKQLSSGPNEISAYLQEFIEVPSPFYCSDSKNKSSKLAF